MYRKKGIKTALKKVGKETKLKNNFFATFFKVGRKASNYDY